jgi:hypothetical protein
MIGKLDTIIEKINTEERFLLSVFDNKAGRYLYKYYPAQKIVAEFQTGENFFESLNEKGHKNLKLYSHLRNGSGKVKLAEPIDVNFTEPTQSDAIIAPITPTIVSKALVPNPINYPNDISGLFGLGAPQVMELMVKKNEADRLTIENAELRADNRSLKEQNEKYREEILKEKYDYQKEKDKKGDTHALIGQLAGSLPAIMSYIKPTSPSEGLNASQSMDYGSPTKNSLVESIKQIDDDTLTMLAIIINNSNTNAEFSNELINLLKKYNLWQ